MKVYSIYCANYKLSIQEVVNLKGKNPQFAQFCKVLPSYLVHSANHSSDKKEFGTTEVVSFRLLDQTRSVTPCSIVYSLSCSSASAEVSTFLQRTPEEYK